MIEVKKIEPQTVEVFNAFHQSLGFLNEYEFNDLRAQIAEQEVESYYLMFDDFQFSIDKHGRYERPTGLFELYGDTLSRLVKCMFKGLSKESNNKPPLVS